MKTWIQQNWLTLLVLVAPFIFITVVWDQIPQRMPVHFDAAMHPNGWMPKPWAPLVLPLAGVFTFLVASLLFQFDPKMAKSDEDTRLHVRKVLSKILLATSALLSTCAVTLLWAAWGNIGPVKYNLFFGLPLLLLVLGNLLGKLRPNYVAGIRLPWTLESPTVWVRTHRFGGKFMVALGLLLLALAISRWQQDRFAWILLGCLTVWAVSVTVYSFAVSRQEQRNSGNALGTS